jgi:hypothetical protein
MSSSSKSTYHYTNFVALLFSLATVFVVFWISKTVFEHTPHVEDEFAYIWQAQVFTHGQAYLPSPIHEKLFTVPFVVDYHGLRFSKYPPGWSLLLAIGMLLGVTSWVNPVLAGFAIWLTYCLGQKIFSRPTALLAAGLMSTSPFFLLNSAQFLTPPWSLILCLSFTNAWLEMFFENEKAPNNVPTWLKVWVAGLSLGMLVLTRPLTAVGVALPFFIHGLTLLWRREPTTFKRILSIGLITTTLAALLPLWQYLLTGNPLQNLYALWWNYDRIGFGNNIGTELGGYNNFYWIFNNLGINLIDASTVLFGWKYISWLFIPFGLWDMRRNKSIEPVIGILAGLILAYTLYWFGSVRYYYEGLLLSGCLLSAGGISWLIARSQKFGVWQIFISLITLVLIGYNLITFLPAQLNTLKNLYGINRAQQVPFTIAKALAQNPALVIVHTNNWTDCAGLLPLQDPWLTTPFIFACDLGNSPEIIKQSEFPGRKILHYYPENQQILSQPRD